MSIQISDKRPVLIRVSGTFYDQPSTPITLTNVRRIIDTDNGTGVYVVVDTESPVVITKTRSYSGVMHYLNLYKIDGIVWGYPSVGLSSEDTISITIPKEYFTAARFMEVSFAEEE